MDQLMFFSKAVALYLLILLPQLRLVSYKYDSHIGNFTTSRVSGKSLASIFFNHNFGVPIPVLSLSIQYDYFKDNASNYKIFHAIMASSAGPLFYLFTWLLSNNEPAAFICSILYAITFNFPITGSWLIKSEHYENVFFLTGGSLLLASGDFPHLGMLGALFVGCCLLCKLPALISVWLMATICIKHATTGEFHNVTALVICYLTPFVIYSIAGRFAPQDNDSSGASTASSDIFSIIKDVPSAYLYFYKRDPAAYIKSHVIYHITEHIKQFLPVIILASFFLMFGRHTDKWAIELGLATVSLIFIIRMGFSYVYSFNIILCIAAGMAFFYVPSPMLEIMAALVLPATVFSYFALRRDPYINAYAKKAATTTEYDVLADYLRKNSAEEETIFCNINYPLSIIHPLSGRGLPCHANLLTIGGYNPSIDHTNVPIIIARDGKKLLSALAAHPPRIIIQSCDDLPILNLVAIEHYCGVSYNVSSIIGSYVIYCLTERREKVFMPDQIDISFLFNAEEGMHANLNAANSSVKVINKLQQISHLKDSVSYAHADEQTNNESPAEEDLTSMCVLQEDGSTTVLDHTHDSGDATSTRVEMLIAAKEALSNRIITERHPHVQSHSKPSCIFLNTYYGAFLNHIYRANTQLAELSYNTQLSVLQGFCFGDSDFYSQGLFVAGWDTDNLIANCAPLQLTWAREHSSATDNLQSILLEQIKQVKPTVVYLQDVNIASPELIREIRLHCDLLAVQHASPIPEHADFSAFDIVFTAAPHFVELFRNAGTACYYQPLAFDPRAVPVMPPYKNRSIDVSFVGGFSSLHIDSYQLFEHLAVTTPINFWGYGSETLPADSAIRSRHHGEAWGKEMFKILANSRITINRHGEIAENHACNMRLYEATGAGTLLITDYKDNLNELFEIGKEVVAYRSSEECAALVNYYLAHPDEAEAIALAGRERTLRDHNYARRMKQTATILERHIRYREEHNVFKAPDLSRISYGHTGISESEVTQGHVTAWQNSSIPAKQRALVQQELHRMYKGDGAAAYQALADIIRPYVTNGTTVLELGCSSGYCYEILEYYLNRQLDYTGVDYSQPMIDMARGYYPDTTFFTADGANLFFADRKFQIVISSCILLHVPNWRQHVYETVRVADKYVVASRTPVCRQSSTRYMKKYAYDVETVELLFNEAEIVREFQLNGLILIDAVQYHSNQADDIYDVTYLFKRP